MKYWKLMGHYNGESQTYEALAGGLASSPFSPDTDGRLIGIRLIPANEAATSLMEGFQIKLTSVAFTPNTIEVVGCGNGLATAPAAPKNVIDYEIDQPVKTTQKITLEGRHAVATAVTAAVFVMGLFSTA